MLFKIDPLH